MAQERTKSGGSEGTFTWPSLPGSSRSTPSLSRVPTNDSAKSTQIATVIPDDPFASTGNNSTGTDTKCQTMVAVSHTSTRSTFAQASRFGEMWSDEEDQDSVLVSLFDATDLVEREGETRAGLSEIKSKSEFGKGKKRDGRSASGTSELASPAKEAPPRKSSWNIPWIPGSPSTEPHNSYTLVPARTSSPRSQSFRTPESSPRKPS